MKQINPQTLYDAIGAIGEDLLVRSEEENLQASSQKDKKVEAPEKSVVTDRFAEQKKAFDARRTSARKRRAAFISGLVAVAAVLVFTFGVNSLRSAKETSGSVSMEVALESAEKTEEAQEYNRQDAVKEPALTQEAGSSAVAEEEVSSPQALFGEEKTDETDVIVSGIVRLLLHALSLTGH